MPPAELSPARRPVYPPAYLLLATLLMLTLHFLLPIRQIVCAPWRYVGLVLMLAGIAYVLYGANVIERAGTTIKPFETSTTLVVQGPYRFSRNPIYLAMAVSLIGLAILAGS